MEFFIKWEVEKKTNQQTTSNHNILTPSLNWGNEEKERQQERVIAVETEKIRSQGSERNLFSIVSRDFQRRSVSVTDWQLIVLTGITWSQTEDVDRNIFHYQSSLYFIMYLPRTIKSPGALEAQLWVGVGGTDSQVVEAVCNGMKLELTKALKKQKQIMICHEVVTKL